MWKKEVVPYFKVLSWCFSEATEETIKVSATITGLRARIRTWVIQSRTANHSVARLGVIFSLCAGINTEGLYKLCVGHLSRVFVRPEEYNI
jgi:hypothetical protein